MIELGEVDIIAMLATWCETDFGWSWREQLFKGYQSGGCYCSVEDREEIA